MSRTLKRGWRVGNAASEALDAGVEQLAKIKAMADQAKKDRSETAPIVLEQMKEANKKTHRIPWSETQDAVASVRERDNSQINADRLKKEIGAKAYNKLTTPVLDEAKVEAAIQLGELDTNIVAKCVDESVTEYVDVRFNKAQKRRGGSG